MTNPANRRPLSDAEAVELEVRGELKESTSTAYPWSTRLHIGECVTKKKRGV